MGARVFTCVTITQPPDRDMNMDNPSNWLTSSPIHPSPFNRYLERLSVSSRRTIRQGLAVMAKIVHGEECDPANFQWERIRPEHIAKIQSGLMEKYKLATVAKMLAGLRGVFKCCLELNLFTKADYDKNIKVCNTQTLPEASTRVVNQTDIDALFRACAETDDNASRRDAALLAIFLTTGLRRSEATSMDLADYDHETGKLHIGVKTEPKRRLIELPLSARQHLARWLDKRGNKPGPLLMPVNRGDKINHRRLTDQAVYDIFRRIAAHAGKPGLTTRDLRRAYVVSLIRKNLPRDEVQALTGHTSWLTNSAYETLATATEHPGYDIENLPVLSLPTENRGGEDTAAGMVEIERKFLVAGEFKHLAKRSMRITQGYLCRDPQRTVRIRIQDDRGYITIKGASDSSGTTRLEWERAISLDEARSLLTLALPGAIDKTRYEVPAGSHIFEVDEFCGDHQGLILAEIELKAVDEHFERPDWLGEEVTGDARYYNAALSQSSATFISPN